MTRVLSIITVCRNPGDLLLHTLESVRAQDHSLFEYVVVDGASTDGSVAVLEKERGLVDLLVSEPDRGISDAMNKAPRLARGELVIFMNAGDSFAAPDVVRRIVEDYRAKPWLWASGATNYMRVPGQVCSKRPFKAYSKKNLHRYNFICHQSTVVTRQGMLDAGGFDEQYKIAMDYAVWLKLAEKADARVLPFTVSNYLLGGLSGRHNRRIFTECKAARRALLNRGFLRRHYEELGSDLWYLVSDSTLAYRLRKLLPVSLKNKVRDLIRRVFMRNTY